MFIQNMTSLELVREYKFDLLEINQNNDRIDQAPSTAKLLKKARKRGRVSFVRRLTTSRGNSYITVYVYVKNDKSTRQTAHWDWKAYSFGLMPTYKGTYVISFYDSANVAIKIQPHFFSRYKERLMKVCDWQTKNQLLQAKTLEDIISVYIRRNPEIIWVNTKSKYKGQEHIFAPINDGVALIQWDGKNIQANTFITEDMCSEQQNDMTEYARTTKQFQQEKDKLFQKLVSLMNGEKLDDNK